MLTLRIVDDQIVNQFQAENPLEPKTQTEYVMEEQEQMTSDTTRKTSANGSDTDASVEDLAINFASMLKPDQLENIVAVQRAQIEAFAKASQVFMDGLTAMGREAAEFRNEHVRTLIQDSDALPSPVDWSKMWTLQATYADRAAQAYIKEATKLFDMGVKLANESLEPLQDAASKGFGELIPKGE